MRKTYIYFFCSKSQRITLLNSAEIKHLFNNNVYIFVWCLSPLLLKNLYWAVTCWEYYEFFVKCKVIIRRISMLFCSKKAQKSLFSWLKFWHFSSHLKVRFIHFTFKTSVEFTHKIFFSRTILKKNHFVFMSMWQKDKRVIKNSVQLKYSCI
jgi:hypothetical protein